jgi:isopentenyldiphosphate isomerase
MEERIDVWDASGQPTGKDCPKDEAHIKGWFHPTVHVWFYTRTGHILLQQRGANKDTFPSLWDVSVAGHVHAGESIEDAVLREVKEEIGLEVYKEVLEFLNLQKNVNIHPNGIIDCEFQHVYLIELQTPIEQLVIQETEVDAIRLFSKEELEHCIQKAHPEYTIVPSDMSYYKFILSEVSKRTS